MTTLKEVLSNTLWDDISATMDTHKGYEYHKYRHNLESIYNELKSLHIVNPMIKDIELHIEDFKWGFSYYIKLGEWALNIDYIPWEILLGLTVNQDTLQRETKETIITLTLNQLFHYGKTKEMSDVNINWMYRSEWLVYTECFPTPLVIIKNKDNNRKNMTSLGKSETLISHIYNPNTGKNLYIKETEELKEALYY